MKPTVVVLAVLASISSLSAQPEPRRPFTTEVVRVATSGCASDSLDLSQRDPSLEFGQWGTLFFDSGLPQCQQAAHDMLLRKVRIELAEPRHFDPLLQQSVGQFDAWLAGANLGLILPTALRLGGAGLLDPPLDLAVRAAIGAYQFRLDPTCGLNFSNGCMDDYSQAAAGYAWIAAYDRKSGQSIAADRAAVQATNLIGRALSLDIHMCKVAGDDSLPVPCRTLPAIEEGLASGYDELVTFNHGFEDVAYGIGLITSISSAAVGLEEAGAPFEAAPSESMVAWALFQEGQRAALPDGSAFRTNCYRVSGSTLTRDSECADAWNLRPLSDPLYNPWIFYLPRMFPVRTAYQRLFHGTPNSQPFQYDLFDASLFTNPFLNDGRRAVYGVIGYAWWNDGSTPEVRPLLDGYHGPPHRERAVRR